MKLAIAAIVLAGLAGAGCGPGKNSIAAPRWQAAGSWSDSTTVYQAYKAQPQGPTIVIKTDP